MDKNKNLQNLIARAVNLNDLIDYQAGSVVSRAIIDKKLGTVSLFAFDKGEGLSEHTTPYNALVYLLEGEADISTSGKLFRIKRGELTIIPANEPHALSAVTKFKILFVMIKE